MKVSSVLTPYLLRLTAAHNTATIVMYSPRWTFATRSDFSRHMWIMIMKLCWQHDANFNPVFSNFAWYVVSFYINKYKCTNSGLVLCITIQYTRCFIKTSPSLIVHKCGKCWQIWIFFSVTVTRYAVMNWSLKVHHTLNLSIVYLLKYSLYCADVPLSNYSLTLTPLWNVNVTKLPRIWNESLLQQEF